MGADTYQAYVDTTIASFAGRDRYNGFGSPLGERALLFPLTVLVAGIVASVLGIVVVKGLARTNKVPERLLRIGLAEHRWFHR